MDGKIFFIRLLTLLGAMFSLFMAVLVAKVTPSSGWVGFFAFCSGALFVHWKRDLEVKR